MKELKNDSSKYNFKVAAFYSFLNLKDELLLSMKEELTIKASEFEVKGTILLANEGINGTISGSVQGINTLLDILQKQLNINSLNVKISWNNKQAFKRFKARLKPEVVTIGIPQVSPSKEVGEYVESEKWNSYLTDPETIVIDTRNDYEIGIGGFEGSINPHTKTFREFPKWVESHLKPLVAKHKPKRIAMFCTGGIRCEKATSYLKQEGFKEVHHLHGGILKYLEDVPLEKSLWKGECFVFDQRVALDHNLLPGEYLLCFACGMPLSIEDRKQSSYIPGIQCHHCMTKFSDKDRARFAERQKQYDLKSNNSSEEY